MARHSPTVRWHRLLLALAIIAQCGLALQGVGDLWTRGHNGWNGSAYHNAARNTVRWGLVFPLQYKTANHPPKPTDVYTHAPLAMHLHHVVAFKLFGDHEASIRGVAAFHAIAIVLMLYFVVSRLWSPWTGAVTAAAYVALPINAIYTNMPNHTSGFILWALVALYLFVRSRQVATGWTTKRFTGFLAAIAMATLWDWPGYYVAFVTAIWWSGTIFADRRDGHRRTHDMLFLGLFCGWTLALFATHFGLVEWLTGNFAELRKTFDVRSDMKWNDFEHHVKTVPAIMFTWGVLAVCVGWMICLSYRTWKGPQRHRDLVPVSFAFAAIVHFVVFRRSAVVHSYWAWPALPFVAIVLGTSAVKTWNLVRDGFRERRSPLRKAASISAFSTVVIVVGLLGYHDLAIVPRARQVGGSMWFFQPVRSKMDRYDSGRSELELARQVRSWTDRKTAVQLHSSLKARRLEPRFTITMDRPIKKWIDRVKPSERLPDGSTSWAYVAVKASLTETARFSYARRFRYREFGEFVFVDTRHPGPDVEIWKEEPAPKSFVTSFLTNSFEPNLTYRRTPEDEATLMRRLEHPTTPRTIR